MAPFELWPPKDFPETNPADWGWKVSVCIALLCENRKKLVCITDQKTSFGGFSAEYFTNKIGIIERTVILYAADHADHAFSILDYARDILQGMKHKTPRKIAQAVNDAYEVQLNLEIESRVLRRYKFTVDSFREKGKKLCTEVVYNKICEKIADVEIKASFLVCSFDDKGDCHIYSAGNEEAIKNYGDAGLWAIGTGQPSALAALSFQIDKQRFMPVYGPLQKCLYVGLDAKFMAESAEGVGRSTFVFVVEKDKDPLFMDDESIEAIRKMWLELGAPRMPDSIIASIITHLRPPKISGTSTGDKK